MNLASPSVRVSCLFGMLSIAALTGFAPPAGAQISEWDHYKVYRVSPSITDGRTILLRDQFISSQHTVFTLDWFANPTEKQLSDGTAFRILDPRTHYSWWRINGPPPQHICSGVEPVWRPVAGPVQS